MTPLPASGAPNNATLTFKDNEGVESVTPWSFTVTYNSIDPAWRVQGTGKDRGINARVVQAQLGTNHRQQPDVRGGTASPGPDYLPGSV